MHKRHLKYNITQRVGDGVVEHKSSCQNGRRCKRPCPNRLAMMVSCVAELLFHKIIFCAPVMRIETCNLISPKQLCRSIVLLLFFYWIEWIYRVEQHVVFCKQTSQTTTFHAPQYRFLLWNVFSAGSSVYCPLHWLLCPGVVSFSAGTHGWY